MDTFEHRPSCSAARLFDSGGVYRLWVSACAAQIMYGLKQELNVKHHPPQTMQPTRKATRRRSGLRGGALRRRNSPSNVQSNNSALRRRNSPSNVQSNNSALRRRNSPGNVHSNNSNNNSIGNSNSNNNNASADATLMLEVVAFRERHAGASPSPRAADAHERRLGIWLQQRWRSDAEAASRAASPAAGGHTLKRYRSGRRAHN